MTSAIGICESGATDLKSEGISPLAPEAVYLWFPAGIAVRTVETCLTRSWNRCHEVIATCEAGIDSESGVGTKCSYDQTG
jgi:hypothetical protein